MDIEYNALMAGRNRDYIPNDGSSCTVCSFFYRSRLVERQYSDEDKPIL